MPIYSQKNVIFVHIPKTGGQTIEDIFHEAGYYSELYGYDCDQQLELSHLTAKQIRENRPDIFWQYYKFAIVRNPWERLVSEYFYRKRDGRFPYIDGEVRDFDHFLEIVLEMNLEERTHLSISHLLPQVKFLYDGSTLLMDFVGRYEFFEREVTGVMSHLGIPGKISHKNKSEHNHYSTYYTASTRDLVRKIYLKDVQSFGYKFESAKPC